MAFIQCSLTDTALSWYIRLNDANKQDCHAFVQAFKNNSPLRKNAYYAHVEATNLTKKDDETVRHLPLEVQQLVEKGWCNENARSYSRDSNNFAKYTSFLDHLHDHDNLDIQDHVHIQIQGTNLIQYNHKPKMIQLTSKYTCITQLKWQTL